VTCEKPNWSLLLDCARGLTARGESPFTRRQLIACVQKSHPDTERTSLDPIIQGMTINASGGPPNAGGTPFERVGRGLFVLRESRPPVARQAEGFVVVPPPPPSKAVPPTDTGRVQERVQALIAGFGDYVRCLLRGHPVPAFGPV
jgi:hypothetical protein